MDDKLVVQLGSWNPWWQKGIDGIKRYDIPDYKREIYGDIFNQYQKSNQIISIIGMRQVGKSTIMRQMIRDLLDNGVNPKNILYVSFDDPYLKTNFSQSELFEKIVSVYSAAILNEDFYESKDKIYMFLDEIHQLPAWEKILKSYYDKNAPVKFTVSGSSSIQLQKKNRESLLGRIAEYTLWPFSFREYVELKSYKSNIHELKSAIVASKEFYNKFIYKLDIQPSYKLLNIAYQKSLLHKGRIEKYLKEYIVYGGFPRAWSEPDFISRQRFLWEGQVGKILFEDLTQVTNIRKPKELELLFAYLIDCAGKEIIYSELAKNLNLHRVTLDRYLSYLKKTFLIFQINSTKSKRILIKRKSSNVKFYLTDIAIRNAFYKKDKSVYFDSNEMGLIAENLVGSMFLRWLYGPHKDEQIGFYRDNSGEVDFIIKTPNMVLPVEVKWRNDVPALKTMDKIVHKWKLPNSLLITKDFGLSFEKGRLSVPLWFFMLSF